MNLLTDIINDVAVEVGVKLTQKEQLDIQTHLFGEVLRRVSWCKHERIAQEGFPWMEKGKAA